MLSVRPIMDPTTARKVDQRSAVTLSLWHCILSWFFMNAEHNHLRSEEYQEVMWELFHDMKILRLIIRSSGTYDSAEAAYKHINKVAGNVTRIFTKIPKQRWAEEISSMMHEFMSMQRVLKEHKAGLDLIEPLPHLAKHKEKHLVCMLTIWYWLAAWSSDLKDQNARHKWIFLEEVEARSAILARHLFARSTTTGHTIGHVSQDVQIMVSYLTAMIEAEPQHWEDVLEHFTETMKEAGSLRGHNKATVEAAKKTLDMAQDHASGASGLTLHRKILRPVPSRPLGSLFKNSIMRRGQYPVVDDIFGDLVEPIGKVIEGLPDTIKYVTDKAADVAKDAIGLGQEIIKDVEKATTTVYNDVKDAVETVHQDVVHLVHGIGEGVQMFAHTVSDWFHHIF